MDDMYGYSQSSFSFRFPVVLFPLAPLEVDLIHAKGEHPLLRLSEELVALFEAACGPCS